MLQGCGTAVPRSFKARNAPITTITQAKAICKPHETVCGIPGRQNTFDFECIDINTAGDSCMSTPDLFITVSLLIIPLKGGGCITPHPFPQADSVLHVLGTDCTRIPNAKNSECSGQHCIVSECNLGWHPNLARDACILNAGGPSNLKIRKVLKREDSLTTNVVANTHVSSDLVARIGAIVSLVSGLGYTPSQIPASSSSSAPLISNLLGGIVDATSTLIASTNVPSLLNNLDALLNVSSLLSSTSSSCGCGTDLGLTDLDDALGNIVAALLNLKSWCSHNVPSDLNLFGLLSGLGLNNSTVAAVVNPDLVDQIKSLVGLVNGLAGVSSSLLPPPTSPSNLSSINTNIINSIVNATTYIVNATTIPSLVSSIGALVNANDIASSLLNGCGCVSDLGLGTFVADLVQVANATLRMQDWCDTHPVVSIPATGGSSTGASTSISNTDELSIDLGLFNLLSLLEPVESGVAVSGTATNTLENGGLAGGLLISTGDVPPVSASATSETIGVPSSTLPVTPSSQGTSDTPIVTGLDDLLSGPGLKCLKASVGGLGNGLVNGSSSPIDEVLNDFGVGPADVHSRIVLGRHMVGRQTLEVKDRRQITADASASVTSELLTKIGDLVSTVLTLVRPGVALPAPSVPQTSAPVVDSSVIGNVLRATEALLNVSSVGTIESEVNGLVAASLASVKTLDNCGCVDNLGLAATYNSLVQIAEASLDLQDWCHGHSMLVSPSPSSTSVNSNSYGQPSTTTNTVMDPIIGLTELLNEFGLLVGLNDDAPLANPCLTASVSVQTG